MTRLPLILIPLLMLAGPALAGRIAAEADCAATGTTLEFHCLFALTQGGAPLEGAVFTVKPDMPSMPMAHNIAPVPASPSGPPGSYEATFTLDMYGRWAMRLDFTAPRRDAVVLVRDFAPGTGGADPAHSHHGHHMRPGAQTTTLPAAGLPMNLLSWMSPDDICTTAPSQ